MSDSFESKIKTYKRKSPQHLQNWKKIWALVNYAKTVDDFQEWEALEFIIRCFFKGYLKRGRVTLLNELIKENNIDYTKWAIKDGWVKMQQLNGHKAKADQMEFWFPTIEKQKIEASYNTPVYSKLERHKLYQFKEI